MTKLALDFGDIAYVAVPGALFGLGGAGLGSLIDMLAGTDRRWTKILGLLGLAGGAGAGGLFRYLDKRSNTPAGRLFQFLDNAGQPAAESFVQQMSEVFPHKVNTIQTMVKTKQPAELIRGLVRPTYMEGGVWLYIPEASTFQLARYFASQTPDNTKLQAIDLAMDIAARGMILSLYQDRIPENLRPAIETHFRNYVNTTIEQVESNKPNWNVPRSHVDSLVKALMDTNQEELKEIATLVASPYSVLKQK